MTDQDLSQLVNAQAKKAGFSQKDAARALDKLKKGGMMAQIAPHLEEQFMSMNPNATPREKLRMKLSRMSAARQTKLAKAVNYEKQREQVLKDKEQEEKEKMDDAANKVKQARNHRRRLRELEKKMGQISDEIYFQSMTALESGKLKDEGEIQRHNNIIELYGQQRSFKEKIDLDEDLKDLA